MPRQFPFSVLVGDRVIGRADTLESATSAAAKTCGTIAIPAGSDAMSGLARASARWQEGGRRVNPGRHGSSSDPDLLQPGDSRAKLVADVSGVLIAGFRSGDRLRFEAAVRDIIAQDKALPRPAFVHIVAR